MPDRLRASRLFGMVVAVLLATGCDRVATIRHPELAACQRFIRSRMRVPGSFDRTWYLISDMGVSRPLLARTLGEPANGPMSRAAPNPAIRDVFVQYDAADGLGQRVKAAANCHFALVDDGQGRYARDIESSVDEAIRENERRTLMVSLGREGIVSADCCLAQGFDLRQLAGIKHVRRGAVIAASASGSTKRR